jgi:hypothetical protein
VVLSLLPLNPHSHYFSSLILSIHFLTTYLPPSSQSSSLPLSLLLPLLYLSPSLLSSSYYLSPFFLSLRGSEEDGKEGGREVVRRRMEKKERERQ